MLSDYLLRDITPDPTVEVLPRQAVTLRTDSSSAIGAAGHEMDEGAALAELTRDLHDELGTGQNERSPDPHVTRFKLLPLNSTRLATDVMKRVAVELGLPGTASRADTLPMIEGKLMEDGQEPRNGASQTHGGRRGFDAY